MEWQQRKGTRIYSKETPAQTHSGGKKREGFPKF